MDLLRRQWLGWARAALQEAHHKQIAPWLYKRPGPTLRLSSTQRVQVASLPASPSAFACSWSLAFA